MFYMPHTVCFGTAMKEKGRSWGIHGYRATQAQKNKEGLVMRQRAHAFETIISLALRLYQSKRTKDRDIITVH